MDEFAERRKAIALIVLLVIFVVSAFLAYREVTYLLLGSSIQGTITRTYLVERHGRWGRPIGHNRRVEYQFIDSSGNNRHGSDDVSLSFPVNESGPVQIRYMPGQDGRTRLDGHVNWIGPLLFVVSTGIMIGGVIWIWRKASAAVSDTGKRRR